MTDSRVRVPLNGKTVDLLQLAGEVGTALTASDVEVVVADATADVTEAELRAAVDAHVPVEVRTPVELLLADVAKASTVVGMRKALLDRLPDVLGR